MEENKNFIFYDYMTKEVKKAKEAMIRDCYESFEWELVSKETTFFGTTILNFRRNRELRSNIELRELQRKMETNLEEKEKIEKQKTSLGQVTSLTMGIIGSLILGGGMSLVMFNEKNILLFILGIIVGVVGIITCALVYPLYKSIVRKKTLKIGVLAEEKNDELFGYLMQANKVLTKD